ncbi:hypothetical protein E2C01_044217 [Portunus trituberculatus]|uniref:Uncharacterized protein n=1 Tax=Portunus trituberculatus TaxID=210409 RepID=A0A5B7FYQ8_PORTR|nr:hypothetical protein [Portunus trituberculatus]
MPCSLCVPQARSRACEGSSYASTQARGSKTSSTLAESEGSPLHSDCIKRLADSGERLDLQERQAEVRNAALSGSFLRGTIPTIIIILIILIIIISSSSSSTACGAGQRASRRPQYTRVTERPPPRGASPTVRSLALRGRGNKPVGHCQPAASRSGSLLGSHSSGAAPYTSWCGRDDTLPSGRCCRVSCQVPRGSGHRTGHRTG